MIRHGLPDPLFHLGEGRFNAGNLDLTINHQGRSGGDPKPPDLVTVVDLFNVGCDSGSLHGVNDHGLQAVATDTPCPQNTDDKSASHRFCGEVEHSSVFPGDGLPVLVLSACWNIVLSADGGVGYFRGLIDVQVVGQGLVEGNIKPDQADGGVADLDHALGGTVHICCDVVRTCLGCLNQ